MTSLFGIPNCGSVKKTRTWLDEHGEDYVFVDFKKLPPTVQQVRGWLKKLGRETLINRKGTTWRTLSDADKALAESDQDAVELVVRQPSLIKRPLIEWNDGTVTVGFDEPTLTHHAKG